jgi:nucleotide-binding universal stress UspA family protein
MKIVHPTDFSDCAERARVLAVQLARALGAELILLHVAVEAPLFREGLTGPRELEGFFEEQREWARRALEERAAESRGQGVPTLARVITGVPHREIVEAARREGAALIVMGTHGRGAVERFFVGSVADRVVHAAPCAVVTRRD